MHKIITISALAAILSLPAFAEIANNATCNNTNLGQSDNNSTANVEANWNANTININWYNGNTKITSNTCTYDGTITLPTQPSKPGYTFAGWRLRAVAAPKQCWEIEDGTECENTEGCAFYEQIGQCLIYTGSCSDIKNKTDCNRSGGNGGIACSWNPTHGTCSLGSGGGIK